MNIKKRGVHYVIIPNLKSQATIFILISLVVMLTGALYFFYQRQAVEKEIEIVQPEIVPVKLFVENCIKSAAENGLETIGLSGGYIEIPPGINGNQRAYLTSLPGEGFKMPYWWYDGIESIPSEDFIKQQLKAYIESQIKSCISNFGSFAAKFEINELKEESNASERSETRSQLSANIDFNDNDVSVKLNYPLEVVAKQGDFKALVENFKYVLPIRFKKVYELAKLIMEREKKDYFLEEKTIDLYSIHTEIPTTDVEASCKTKIWQLSKIKDTLKTLLRVNLPYIRIKGTDYNPNLYVPNPDGKSTYLNSYYQQHYIWEIDKDADKKYKNMKVAFKYENWPLDIYARPNENGILRSNVQKGTEMLSFLCLQIWHFTYDVSYPVLVTISDSETDTNKAYQFNFAFKADVDHNQPNRISRGTALFETTSGLSSEEYCNTIENEMAIYTLDNSTGEDITGVNLTFVCGRFYCDMGKSDWLSFGAAAGIIKRFPYCINGVIKGTKEGYVDSNSFVQTDAERTYALMLNPVKEFKNYKIVKQSLSSNIVQELDKNEKASIQIKGKTGYENFVVFPDQVGLPLKIPLKDETYEVNIYVVDNDNIVAGYIGNWIVSKDLLKGANEIVFHVAAQEFASDDERALFVSELSSHSKKVPAPELR